MDEQAPRVTAIITTYNRKERVKRAIRSVINQSYNNLEIIVVDDSSDYDVYDNLSEFRDSIQIFRNEENRGANWSRMKGIKHADGKYISFLDDDDMWKSGKIEKQVQQFNEAAPSVGVVTTGMDLTNGGTSIPGDLDNSELTRILLTGENIIGGFSVVMVDRTAINQAGPPDPSLSSSQDLEWYIRLSDVCDFAVVKEPLVVHDSSKRDDRITRKRVKAHDDSFGDIIDKHHDIVEGFEPRTRKKIQSERHYRLARYAAATGDFPKSRQQAIAGIKLDPTRFRLYMLLLVSLLGHRGYKVAYYTRQKIKYYSTR